MAAVSPEKNDVSPLPEEPSMITRPMSIPNLFMAPGSASQLISGTIDQASSYSFW